MIPDPQVSTGQRTYKAALAHHHDLHRRGQPTLSAAYHADAGA